MVLVIFLSCYRVVLMLLAVYPASRFLYRLFLHEPFRALYLPGHLHPRSKGALLTIACQQVESPAGGTMDRLEIADSWRYSFEFNEPMTLRDRVLLPGLTQRL
ncbi:hypothetical protein F5146DRAFT_383712 [Armillaria mellea]|nr:hypothetical protein F5146DRAFT_383712 [Armillaria mellea]